MALVQKTTAPYLNSGVRVKPFRVERPPSYFELARRQVHQLRRELVGFFAQEVMQMTIDTLYVLRYLRMKFQLREPEGQATFETVRAPLQELERVPQRGTRHAEHAPVMVEQ